MKYSKYGLGNRQGVVLQELLEKGGSEQSGRTK